MSRLHSIDRHAPMRRLPTRLTITAAALALAALLAPARDAAAQRVTTRTAPACAPPVFCASLLVRFDLFAPAAAPLVLETLTLTFDPAVATFRDAGHGTPYTASDDWGPFAGFGTVAPDGDALFIDFLDTGDPTMPGLPLTIGAGGAGWLEVTMSRDTRPEALTFAFQARLEGGATIAGVGRGIEVVPTTTPEPSALALLALGGSVLAAGARRRLAR